MTGIKNGHPTRRPIITIAPLARRDQIYARAPKVSRSMYVQVSFRRVGCANMTRFRKAYTSGFCSQNRELSHLVLKGLPLT